MTHSMNQLPVFVYGTLRNGFGNYRLLEGRTLKEETAFIDGAIYPVHQNGGFPCYTDRENGVVVGELMLIKPNVYDDTLRSLDMLEGYHSSHINQSMYIRKIKKVRTEHGEMLAYVYVWNVTHGRPLTTEKIDSGCWKTFEKQRQASKLFDNNHMGEWV